MSQERNDQRNAPKGLSRVWCWSSNAFALARGYMRGEARTDRVETPCRSFTHRRSGSRRYFPRMPTGCPCPVAARHFFAKPVLG